MNRKFNILTIVFQLVSTFILTLGVYLIYALLDSDFGFDGLVGLLIFQPLLGTVISILTIFVCLIVGLPIRLDKRINKWWADNFYIPIIGTGCGLIFLFLATLPYFTETVSTDINGQQTFKQIPNSFLSYTGWVLTAFMTLHIFPPDNLVNWIKKMVLPFKTSWYAFNPLGIFYVVRWDNYFNFCFDSQKWISHKQATFYFFWYGNYHSNICLFAWTYMC